MRIGNVACLFLLYINPTTLSKLGPSWQDDAWSNGIIGVQLQDLIVGCRGAKRGM